jgi:hypothetical protein
MVVVKMNKIDQSRLARLFVSPESSIGVPLTSGWREEAVKVKQKLEKIHREHLLVSPTPQAATSSSLTPCNLQLVSDRSV